jgi:predicted unusual protein kinase regulating ubiquinone biosynthesis (AarF/ABC1/UbiB family)
MQPASRRFIIPFMLRRRYFRILFFFGQTFLNVIWWDVFLPRVGFRRRSLATRRARMQTIARHFRNLAVHMGGVMIKVGQFLSSRLDVLPREITDELAGLQDEVAPEPFEPIQALIEAEFGMPLDQKFSHFEREPQASASIGQVYCAQLCATQADGTPCPTVIVKVQRPHIEEVVETDLSALRIVGGWLQRYKPVSKHANVPRLFEEFSRSLHEEMDYLHEGKNAETFAENFKDQPGILVPKVIWSHTSKRVLTLEDVGGIKITDYAAIEAAGLDRKVIAKRLVDTYLQQIFEDGFFHADPHPGNLFVQPPPRGGYAGDWKLTFVDFGMTGTLTENTFHGLREVLISIGTQDAHRVVQAYQELDVLLPHADLDLLERASQRLFDRFWGKSTAELRKMHQEEAQEFFDDFGDLIYEMPFQVPENLILLGRCMGILSGMCSGLDPEFSIWQSVVPYTEEMVEAEGGGKWNILLDEIIGVLQKLVALPAKTDALISQMSQGRMEVRTPALTREVEWLTRSQRKIAVALVFAAFLLGGVQLYIAGYINPAIGFGVIAGFILFWILFGR